MTATELACARGERSDVEDCADIRLDGAIPGSRENGGRCRTRKPEATVILASNSSSCWPWADIDCMYVYVVVVLGLSRRGRHRLLAVNRGMSAPWGGKVGRIAG